MCRQIVFPLSIDCRSAIHPVRRAGDMDDDKSVTIGLQMHDNPESETN